MDIDALRSATNWTSAFDPKNRVMHFHTHHNRRGRQINLSELYFDAKKINRMPLEVEKVQDIDNITTKLGN